MKKVRKKILIADPDETTAALIKKGALYQIEVVKTGSECLQKLDTFKPDLIVLELMLPHIHGIEIVRKIKQDPRTKHIGTILISANLMMQNYQAALNAGCDTCVEKPFSGKKLHALLTQFFKGKKLEAEPFSGKTSSQRAKRCYVPKPHFMHSYLKFWGTRGSNPVSGPDYVRFGGNTSCLEIRHHDDLIIVDAGTGIRPLGLQAKMPKQIHLLLSHTHWDHLAGFPFFAPLYDPQCQITIWAPLSFEKPIAELFTEMLAYSYFPVRLDDIQAKLVFKEMQEGVPFQVGDIKIQTHYAYHPGATLCFKFTVGKTCFGYVTDNEFLMGYHEAPRLITSSHPLLKPYLSQIRFFKSCDFLIHEAQYTADEYQKKVGWGHSSMTNAAILMRHADIHQWILTHHDPKHVDLELLKKNQTQYDIFDELGHACHTRMAFDGMMLSLP